MKMAIMQPYFFPYIGYYQLTHSVDEFIFFDDANYIKKGYINRNVISANRIPLDFTLPVKNISQNRKINQHFYVPEFNKIKKTIFLCYQKSPFFPQVFPIIESILSIKETNVAILNSKTIVKVFDYLEIQKKFSFSSSLEISDELKGQARITAICELKKCSVYHNPIGAKKLNLYNEAFFLKHHIHLKYINRACKNQLALAGNNFSVIDLLMNYHPDQIRDHLNDYELINP